MKNLIITGSYPPDTCGVGDYTYNLCQHMDPSTWILYHDADWSLWSFIQKIRYIRHLKIDNIYIQYPTEGYGWSIVPQLICLYFSFFTKKKTITVLHEFSNRTFRAKIASALFFFSTKIIFTSNIERDYAIHKWFVPRAKCHVIKILPNIVQAKLLKDWANRTIDLAYFGHLRPFKGLEDFLFVARQISIESPICIAIIGQSLPVYDDFLQKLRREYPEFQSNWIINNNIDNVSELLSNTKICFLPFPDGLSERRGSFLAALINGAIIVSYNGKYMTPELKNLSILTNKESADHVILQTLRTTTSESFQNHLKKSKRYFQESLPSSWEDIVTQYENILLK